MELSENDVIMLGIARIGSLVILDGGVVKVIDRGAGYVEYMIMACMAFALCPNMADTIMDHGVLGLVPACSRCNGVLA